MQGKGKSRGGLTQPRQKHPKSKGKDMKVLIEHKERAGVYDSEVMVPRPERSKVKRESVKGDKTSEPNSGNCTVEMAPKSKVQHAREEGQHKKEVLVGE